MSAIRRMRQIPAAALLGALVTVLSACSDESTLGPANPSTEWPMFGGSLERTSFNANETVINSGSVARLIPRWRFLTGAIVTAAPVVADVDLAGEGRVSLVFEPSWDGNFYALRAADGSFVWSFRFKPHPGAENVQGASAAVADVGGRRLVFIAGGETMYCLDAASGARVWQFDAGTGCTDCDRLRERNEILSPPVVHGGVVYFGMDVNELATAKGGFFALDADSGALRWYFDLQTVSTCRPNAGDEVRRFDGFHSAESLGLPEDFFATRTGCDFDRRGNGCGSVYAGAAIDAKRGLLFTASNNCDAANGEAAPAPDLDEAIIALHLDGTLAWSWRPREADPLDLDFGATPNLFAIEVGGEMRDVVGEGGKDGTYYVLDRDGVNALTGRIEPYWRRQVVAGGAEGGIIASPAVGEGKVFFATAFGTDDNGPGDFQRPAAWGLDAPSGEVSWSAEDAPASFSPSFGVPGIAFMGSYVGSVYAYDASTGQRLAALPALGPLFSQAVAVGGNLYVGAGSGAREAGPEDVAFAVSLVPSPLSAFCVAGTDGCPESGKCIDANPCTADSLDAGSGRCTHDKVADGTACRVGAWTGQCRGGECEVDGLECDDHNPCTRDGRAAHACTYESEPSGTACASGGVAGTCEDGACVVAGAS